MSVYVDRLIAYTVDFNKDDLDQDIKDIIIYDEGTNSNIMGQLREIGFQVYDRNFNPSNGALTVVYDGMSGEYTKACYVIYNDINCDDYSDTEFYTELNNIMHNIIVPSIVKEQLFKMLSIIGIEKYQKNPKLEVFRHFR